MRASNSERALLQAPPSRNAAAAAAPFAATQSRRGISKRCVLGKVLQLSQKRSVEFQHRGVGDHLSELGVAIVGVLCEGLQVSHPQDDARKVGALGVQQQRPLPPLVPDPNAASSAKSFL
eukprot:CAMPEP_0171800164 /NCGR_PEP_ID=MMETSP0991-20121206/71517_1 /TAXON_ID=483369 /ORGANISM="non described non described, Strain CCMP2098" /LENGTH=119 /DNA_ID=CAMNT_0012411623 /DNA_START=181 /DNA_END=541 /DNA_ORIENTATION=+